MTWDDVGAMENIREELQLAILAPLKHEAEFRSLGLSAPAGRRKVAAATSHFLPFLTLCTLL